MRVRGKHEFDKIPTVNGGDNLTGIKTTAADPVAGNDDTQGYYAGYVWNATGSSKSFVCLDASTGAAVWSEISKLSAADIKTLYESNAGTNAFTDALLSKLNNIEPLADVTDSANVEAAGAVMDSDISEAEGFVRKTGAGAYEAIKSNLNASVAPATTNDSTEGYAVGSIWIDTTADKVYQCVDNTATSAVWKDLTTTGGASNSFETWTIDNTDTEYTWAGTDGSIVADSTADTVTLVAGSNVTLDRDAASDAIRITSTGGGSSKFNTTTYAYNYVSASGTWNGVTVGAVGSTEFNDSWRVASFAGTGQPDGFYINFKLPSTYVAGTNLRVILDFSTLVGTGGGTAHIGVGLRQPTAGNALGNETETQYITQNLTVPAGDNVVQGTFTFTGTNISPNDQIAVLVYRDPGNGGDTNNETLYNSTILVEEV